MPLLERLPDVAGVSPMVSRAVVALRGEHRKPSRLMGVDLGRYDRVVGLRSKWSAVRGWRPARRSWGAGWRPAWAMRVGDRLTVQTSGTRHRDDSVRVTALVDAGVGSLNRLS